MHWSLCKPTDHLPSHLPSGRICFVVLVMRKGGESSWSGYRLYSGSFLCAQLPGPVHTARLGRVCFAVFSLGLYFCMYCFNLFMCHHHFVSLGSSVISLTGFGAGVTNLNEPPRAFATSTIAWVRSKFHPFWAIVNKSNDLYCVEWDVKL